MPGAGPDTTRVLLVDDHKVFAESLALGLATRPGVVCAGIAHTVAGALAVTAAFDVALVDLQLPDGDGFTAVRGLVSRRPDAAVLVLTAHPRPGLVGRAAEAGAYGLL